MRSAAGKAYDEARAAAIAAFNEAAAIACEAYEEDTEPAREAYHEAWRDRHASADAAIEADFDAVPTALKPVIRDASRAQQRADRISSKDSDVMKFVLQLWPDYEGTDADPQDLLRGAIQSAADNPDLVWDILNDDDTVLYANVSAAHFKKWTP